MRETERALLLSGPSYIDRKRPLTQPLKRFVSQLDPLGIAIVSAVLKRHGFEVKWGEINPKSTRTLKGEIENSSAVFISSRHFDTTPTQEVIRLANRIGKQIVVGGYGPSLNPEAFDGATVVRGEGEPVLETLIDDLLCKRLGLIYDATVLPPFDLSNYIWPDRSIFPQWPPGLRKFRKHSQEWQRGCYNRCSFCSPCRVQKEVRVRKPKDIIAEIESLNLKPGDFIFSLDLNTMAIPRENLIEIFFYLKNKGLRWFLEGTVAPLIADLEEYGEESLLSKMSPKDGLGGCYSFLYGADDLVASRVKGSTDKERGLLRTSAEIFRKFRIPLNFSVIVGLDNHEYPVSFFEILSALQEAGAPYSFLHIATPYLGTPWGDNVYKGEQVFETDSLNFNHRNVVFEPKNMTREQLQQGFYWLLKRMYSPEAILRNVRGNFDATRIRNPILETFLSGLPWSVETWLCYEELSARGYVDQREQRFLNHEYLKYISS